VAVAQHQGADADNAVQARHSLQPPAPLALALREEETAARKLSALREYQRLKEAQSRKLANRIKLLRIELEQGRRAAALAQLKAKQLEAKREESEAREAELAERRRAAEEQRRRAQDERARERTKAQLRREKQEAARRRKIDEATRRRRAEREALAHTLAARREEERRAATAKKRALQAKSARVPASARRSMEEERRRAALSEHEQMLEAEARLACETESAVEALKRQEAALLAELQSVQARQLVAYSRLRDAAVAAAPAARGPSGARAHDPALRPWRSRVRQRMEAEARAGGTARRREAKEGVEEQLDAAAEGKRVEQKEEEEEDGDATGHHATPPPRLHLPDEDADVWAGDIIPDTARSATGLGEALRRMRAVDASDEAAAAHLSASAPTSRTRAGAVPCTP
jgi:hypothetical protein